MNDDLLKQKDFVKASVGFVLMTMLKQKMHTNLIVLCLRRLVDFGY